MNETVVEGVSKMPETVAAYFTAVGETVTGLIGSGVKVFSQIWESGAPGQVICTMGIASACIGIGMSIFHIRKGRKARR